MHIRRRIAKLLISRSEDDGRPLPRWVSRRLARDAELRAYYVRLGQLASRLRAESDFACRVPLPVRRDPGLPQTLPREALVRRAPKRLFRPALVSVAIAASCLAVLFFGPWLGPAARRVPVDESKGGLTVVEPVGATQDARPNSAPQAGPRHVDLRTLIATANAGEQVARQIADGTSSWIYKASDFSALVDGNPRLLDTLTAEPHLDQVIRRWQSTLRQIADQLTPPVSESRLP